MKLAGLDVPHQRRQYRTQLVGRQASPQHPVSAILLTPHIAATADNGTPFSSRHEMIRRKKNE